MRLWREQPGCFIDANIDTDDDRWQHSRRRSAGLDRDQQSRSRLLRGSANTEHIAHDQPAEFDCAERRHIRFIGHNRNRDDSRSVGKHAHAVRIDFHW